MFPKKHIPSLNNPRSGVIYIPPKYGPEKKRFQDKIMPLFKSFTSGKGATGNIHKALDSRNEIWFKTPYYYLVDAANRHGFGGFEIMQHLGLIEGGVDTDPRMQGY